MFKLKCVVVLILVVLLAGLVSCNLAKSHKSTPPPTPTSTPISIPTPLLTPTIAPTSTPTPTSTSTAYVDLKAEVDGLVKTVGNLPTATDYTTLKSEVDDLSKAVKALPTPSPSVDISGLKSEIASLVTNVAELSASNGVLFQVASGNSEGSPSYIGAVNSFIGTNAPNVWVGQVFNVTTPGYLTGLNGRFERGGNPGAVSFYLAPATNQLPSGSIMDSGTILLNSTSNTNVGNSSYTWINVPMSPIYLAAGSYAIAMSAPQANKDNWVNWGADGNVPNYPYGAAVVSTNSGGSWTVDAGIVAVFMLNMQPSMSYTGTTSTGIHSIEISPAISSLLARGSSVQFAAFATYYNSTTLVNVTGQVTWITSNASIVTITTSGVIYGVADGAVTITATLSGVVSSPVSLTVYG